MVAQTPGAYAFDNARVQQLDRLNALEELLDAGTVRHLEALGVTDGWRCLEVGAGGGSIARWLCERVGRTGHVTATDLDTRFVEATLLHQSNSRVLRHDLLGDDLPAASFDLVHARLLLAWLEDPRRGLARLVAALKPGAWLLVEEMDFFSLVACDDGEGAFSRVVAAHNTLLAQQHTFDPAFGRRLQTELELAGLARVHAEGRVGIWRGGSAGGRVWQLTLEQLQDALVASGSATPQDVERAIRLCADPAFCFMSQVTMAAWGQRPTD